ncbi:MAG TPA: TadE/TadG family type IV pilus assembly protein [Terriglobales bacterium]|nr:TadE/TadG family type IV pilus assembly protein [Terriglobales bacterium]
MIKRVLSLRSQRFAIFKCEAGQALAEACLCVPFFFLLLLGAVDLARAAYMEIEVTNAAKAAVQYGAQNSATATDTSSIANAAATDASGLSSLHTTVSIAGICSDGSACTGTGGMCRSTDCSSSHIETVLTVNVATTYHPVFSVMGINRDLRLQGQAVQKVLNQ